MATGVVRRRVVATVAVFGAAATLLCLTSCRTEYHGMYSGIDGVLWRQIAAFEDPLSRDLFRPDTADPAEYLEGLPGSRWDGSNSSAAGLEIGQQGGVVLYAASSTRATAAVSVFIASGDRPDVPTDDGTTYGGPSAIFTCYRIRARFDEFSAPSVTRILLERCPRALVARLPPDAAFASAEVFDG